MNVNEIRGYIFGGFAIVCFIGRNTWEQMLVLPSLSPQFTDEKNLLSESKE